MGPLSDPLFPAPSPIFNIVQNPSSQQRHSGLTLCGQGQRNGRSQRLQRKRPVTDGAFRTVKMAEFGSVDEMRASLDEYKAQLQQVGPVASPPSMRLPTVHQFHGGASKGRDAFVAWRCSRLSLPVPSPADVLVMEWSFLVLTNGFQACRRCDSRILAPLWRKISSTFRGTH